MLDVPLRAARGARRRGRGASSSASASTWLRAQGAEVLELEVLAVERGGARTIYERWGFAPVELRLAAPVDALLLGSSAARRPDVRLDPRPDRRLRRGRARGAQGAAAVRPVGAHEVTGPHNGWVTVHDELVRPRPVRAAALGKELSYTSGGVVLALGVEDGARRALHALRPRLARRRVRVGARVPRPAAARRRDRTRREPDGRRAADGRRACARARDRAHGRVARRPAARARAATRRSPS